MEMAAFAKLNRWSGFSKRPPNNKSFQAAAEAVFIFGGVLPAKLVEFQGGFAGKVNL